MPEVLADLAVKLSADLQGFKKGLSDGNSSAGEFESHSSHVFAKIGGAIAALGVTAAATKFFTGAIEEARQAEKTSADTANTLKTTGASAWETAGKVDSLATSLSNYSAMNQDLVHHGENVLLMFHNVKNAGTGVNAVFDRSSKVAVDLSAKMGMDLQSAFKLVGKAMEDPIKGAGALAKVMGPLDDSQKKLIKSMMASGDLLGAQKLLLTDLEKTVGGSAGAMADPWDKLKVTWQNIQRQVGEKLLPVLNKVIEWASGLLPKALAIATKAWVPIKAAIDAFIGGWENADAKVSGGGWIGFLITAGQDARVVFDLLRTGLDTVVSFLRDHMTEVMIGAVAAIAGMVIGFQLLAVSATEAAVAEGVALAPLLLIGAAFALAAIGIYEAYEHFKTFRDVVNTVKDAAVVAFGWIIGTGIPALVSAFNWVRANVVPVVEQIVGVVLTQFGHLVSWVETEWPRISEATTHVFNAVRDVITTVMEVIEGIVAVVILAVAFIWEHAHTQIMAVAKATWDTIQAVISAAIEIVKDIINLVLDVINGDWGKAWHDITDIFSTVWGLIITVAGNFMVILWNLFVGALQVLAAIVGNGLMAVLGWFASLPGSILGALGDLGGLLIWAGLSLISGLKNGAVAAAEGLWGWLRSIGGAVIGVFWDAGSWLWNTGWSVLQGLWNGMKSAWDHVTGWLSSLNPGDFFNDINLRLGHAHENLVPTGKAVFAGLQKGMQAGWNDTTDWLSTLDPSAAIGGGRGLSALAVSRSNRQTINHVVTINHQGELKVSSAGATYTVDDKSARAIRDALIKVSGTTGSLWGGR